MTDIVGRDYCNARERRELQTKGLPARRWLSSGNNARLTVASEIPFIRQNGGESGLPLGPYRRLLRPQISRANWDLAFVLV